MKTFATLCAGAVIAAGIVSAAADSRLIDAVKARDADAVRTLIAQGADVNAAEGDGSTPLHWSAANGDMTITEALLKAGARVTAATRIGGMSPLFMAAKNGSAEVVAALLQAGAEAREANSNGTTVLMMAAAAGSAPAVTMLLDRGADPDAKESTSGQTALMFAAARNSADAIRALLAHRADPSVATRVLPLKRVRVDANGDPLPDGDAEKPAGRSSEKQAGGSAAPDQEKLPGVGFDKDGHPLRYKNDERVFGATVIGGMTALHFAAREGAAGATRALVEGGAAVNLVSGGEKTSPIVEAIINGHLDLARYLLQHGADVRLANIDGLTPLYAAIDMRWRHNTWYPQPTIEQEQTDYLEFMRELLDHGADVNAPIARKLWFRKFRYGDDWVEPVGATPFWRAAQANDVDAMRLLAAHGADASIKTYEGVSPLMVLAGAGYHGNDAITIPAGRMPAMSYLVEELGANVNETDEIAGANTRTEHIYTRGYTPIHNAAARGDNEMILYLVSKGARVDLVGKNGVTSVDMANSPRERIEPFPETIKLLESLGAKNSHHCVAC